MDPLLLAEPWLVNFTGVKATRIRRDSTLRMLSFQNNRFCVYVRSGNAPSTVAEKKTCVPPCFPTFSFPSCAMAPRIRSEQTVRQKSWAKRIFGSRNCFFSRALVPFPKLLILSQEPRLLALIVLQPWVDSTKRTQVEITFILAGNREGYCNQGRIFSSQRGYLMEHSCPQKSATEQCFTVICSFQNLEVIEMFGVWYMCAVWLRLMKFWVSVPRRNLSSVFLPTPAMYHYRWFGFSWSCSLFSCYTTVCFFCWSTSEMSSLLILENVSYIAVFFSVFFFCRDMQADHLFVTSLSVWPFCKNNWHHCSQLSEVGLVGHSPTLLYH